MKTAQLGLHDVVSDYFINNKRFYIEISQHYKLYFLHPLFKFGNIKHFY